MESLLKIHTILIQLQKGFQAHKWTLRQKSKQSPCMFRSFVFFNTESLFFQCQGANRAQLFHLCLAVWNVSRADSKSKRAPKTNASAETLSTELDGNRDYILGVTWIIKTCSSFKEELKFGRILHAASHVQRRQTHSRFLGQLPNYPVSIKGSEWETIKLQKN